MNNTVHITFDEGTMGSLKMYLGTDINVVCLDAYLGFGDISNVEDFNTRKSDYQLLFKHMFFEPLETPPNKEQILRFYKEINKFKNLSTCFKIYASKKYIHEYCGLLYVCSLLQNEKLYLFDFPEKYSRPDWYLNDLINRKVETDNLTYSLINHEEKDSYNGQWIQLKEINSELRVIENNKIINHKYSDYYDYIKSFYSNGKEQDYIKIIGNILDKQNNLDYSQLVMISNKMIDNGELKIIREEPDKYYHLAKKVFVLPNEN